MAEKKDASAGGEKEDYDRMLSGPIERMSLLGLHNQEEVFRYSVAYVNRLVKRGDEQFRDHQPYWAIEQYQTAYRILCNIEKKFKSSDTITLKDTLDDKIKDVVSVIDILNGDGK